jgi:hypothetical protein
MSASEQRPVVSVVIASYNMGQHIASAIEPITKQTY